MTCKRDLKGEIKIAKKLVYCFKDIFIKKYLQSICTILDSFAWKIETTGKTTFSHYDDMVF